MIGRDRGDWEALLCKLYCRLQDLQYHRSNIYPLTSDM